MDVCARESKNMEITAEVADNSQNYTLDARLKDAELFAWKLFGSAPQTLKVSIARLQRGTEGVSIQHSVLESNEAVESILNLVRADLTAASLGCYARITLLRAGFIGSGRGTEKDSAGTLALWADLDTYKTSYDQDTVKDRLLAGYANLPVPSIIVNSGNGLQVYWLLNIMCTDLDAIKQYNKGIVQALNEFGADSTFNPAQVLRIPGTTNRKDPLNCRPVKIIYYNRFNIYEIEQFPAVAIEDKKYITAEEVPDDFLEQIRQIDIELHNRIMSEITALNAGARAKSTGRVDRSQNDMWVLVKLFSIGRIGASRITSGLLLSLMRRADLFIGSKTAEIGEDYALRSILQAEKFTSRIQRQDPQRFFIGRLFVPSLLGEEILYEQHFLAAGQQLWIYDKGVFKSNAMQHLKRIIAEKMGTKWQRSYAVAVNDWILAMSQHNLASDVRPLANVLNGMLQITSNSVHLLDHSPTYCSLSQMPVTFTPKENLVQAFEILDEFVADILYTPAAIKAFYQFAGTILLPDYRFKKALLLIGSGDCGKSTLLSLLMYMVGETNISARTFQDLAGGNRFAKASLLGKLANVYADLPALEAKDVGPFKALTGNDIVDAEFKGVDAITFRNYAKLIFSANVFPIVKMADQAFFNRWLIIPCSTKFVQDDAARKRIEMFEKNLRIRAMDREKLTKLYQPKILSALLWRAIEGLQSLMIEGTFATYEESQLAQGEFMAASDPVYGFFSSCTVADNDARVLKNDMFTAFLTWCGLLNIEKISIRVFNRRLTELRSTLGIYEATNSTITVDGVTKQGNIVIGRKLRDKIVTSTGNLIHLSASFGIQKTWED